jgi:hypothetical protein
LNDRGILHSPFRKVFFIFFSTVLLSTESTSIAVLRHLVLVHNMARQLLATRSGLGGLAVSLCLSLLRLGELRELAARADEETAGVPDGKNKEGNHHRENVKGV